jgi:hypothetical protein
MHYALLICCDQSAAVSDEERSRREAQFIAIRDRTRAACWRAAVGCNRPRLRGPCGAGTGVMW